MTLVGLTDKNDILFIQAYMILKSKNIHIDHVRYIRTKDMDVNQDIIQFWHERGVAFNYDKLSNEGKISSDMDYDRMENEILKWYREIVAVQTPYVFIGGGNKTHALALQKAAFYFGALDIFHVFYDGDHGSEPKSVQSIEEALATGRLTFSLMGGQSGWPAIKSLANETVSISGLGRSLTDAISRREIDHVNEFPFESINLLPRQSQDWLGQPLSTDDINWIRHLPKVELHSHLGGYATHGRLLDEIRNASDSEIGDMQDIPYPKQWPQPMTPVDLLDYMKLGDNNGSYLLTDMGCLKKQCKSLYRHFIDQNIRYAEVRCSPYNYASEERSGEEVVTLMMSSFDACMQERRNRNTWCCHVNLIIIATRKEVADNDSIRNHLQLAIRKAAESKMDGACRIVAVDLAGYEHETTRAKYFEKDFDPVHRAGVAVTIHAGENDEVEGIWQAVFKLNTRRIGHGLNLKQSEKLMQSVVNRKIGVEMCPYANYQIKGYKPMPHVSDEYPLLDYLRRGVQVTVNTDNISISNATLSENFLFLTTLCPGISRMEILQLIRNGLEQAFISHSMRKTILREFNQFIFNLIYSGFPPTENAG